MRTNPPSPHLSDHEQFDESAYSPSPHNISTENERTPSIGKRCCSDPDASEGGAPLPPRTAAAGYDAAAAGPAAKRTRQPSPTQSAAGGEPAAAAAAGARPGPAWGLPPAFSAGSEIGGPPFVRVSISIDFIYFY